MEAAPGDKVVLGIVIESGGFASGSRQAVVQGLLFEIVERRIQLDAGAVAGERDVSEMAFHRRAGENECVIDGCALVLVDGGGVAVVEIAVGGLVEHDGLTGVELDPEDAVGGIENRAEGAVLDGLFAKLAGTVEDKCLVLKEDDAVAGGERPAAGVGGKSCSSAKRRCEARADRLIELVDADVRVREHHERCCRLGGMPGGVSGDDLVDRVVARGRCDDVASIAVTGEGGAGLA